MSYFSMRVLRHFFKGILKSVYKSSDFLPLIILNFIFTRVLTEI